MATKPEKSAEPKYVINPSAPSTGTEGWGYGKNEASSVNFGVPTEEHATAEKEQDLTGHVVGSVPVLPNLVARSSDESTSNGAVDEEEKIRRRAYELYLERGEEHGHHEEDWERAKAELRSANGPISSAKTNSADEAIGKRIA